jgi:hypothetical protein
LLDYATRYDKIPRKTIHIRSISIRTPKPESKTMCRDGPPDFFRKQQGQQSTNGNIMRDVHGITWETFIAHQTPSTRQKTTLSADPFLPMVDALVQSIKTHSPSINPTSCSTHHSFSPSHALFLSGLLLSFFFTQWQLVSFRTTHKRDTTE